jgi:hypothetical protein
MGREHRVRGVTLGWTLRARASGLMTIDYRRSAQPDSYPRPHLAAIPSVILLLTCELLGAGRWWRHRREGNTMTQDIPSPAGGSGGRRYRAWDGSVWPDRDSRDVHNHTHPNRAKHTFVPMPWSDDDLWGAIKR